MTPLRAISLLTASLLFLRPGTASAGADANPIRLVVIVSQDSPIHELTSKELRRIFLAEPTYVQGQRVIPINLAPEHRVRDLFDRLVLGMSPAQAGRYWVDRKIRALGVPPKSVTSTALLQRLVAKLPGAIAYLPANEVSDQVRVIRIDGKTIDDPTYPLGGVAP